MLNNGIVGKFRFFFFDVQYFMKIIVRVQNMCDPVKHSIAILFTVFPHYLNYLNIAQFERIKTL
jgi:hypothetical protein